MTAYSQEYLNETFDADIPATWSTDSEQDANPWYWVDGLGFETLDGTGYVMVDPDAAGSTQNLVENLESPGFDASAGNIVIIQFDTYYNDYIGLDTGYVQVWDGTAWNTVWQIGDDLGGWNNSVAVTAIITDHVNPSGDTKIRFHYDDGDTYAWYWSVDNVVVSSVDCLEPINIVITEGAIAADIVWQSGSGNSDLLWGLTGFDPLTEGTLLTDLTSPYLLTGLDPETTYDFYLKDDCGVDGESEYAGPNTFTTTVACPDVIVPFNPFTNPTSTSIDISFTPGGLGDVYIILGDPGFILGDAGDTIGPITSPYTIDGLTQLTFYDVYWFMDCTGDDLGYSVTSFVKSFNTLTDAAGTSCVDPIILNNNLPYVVVEQSICGYGDNVTLSPTPCGNWVSGYEEIVFAYAPESDDEVLGIFGSNFNTNSTVYFEVMDMCPDSADAACVASGSWTTWSGDETFLLTDAILTNGETYYVMITGYTGSGCTFDLNIFIINCATPTNLTYTAYADSTVVTWTSNNDDLTIPWQVEWGIEGFTQGEGTTVDGNYTDNGNSLTITGLSDTVNYSFYVSDVCGFGNVSIPGGPSLFTGPPPANNLCADAVPLVCGESVPGNTSAATFDADTLTTSCNGWSFINSPSVWYSFTGDGNEITLSTCGAGWNTSIFVYSGDCSDTLFCEAYNSGNWVNGMSHCDYWGETFLTMVTEPGVNYSVAVVGGGINDFGSFNLAFECIPCSTPINLNVETTSNSSVLLSWESLNSGVTSTYEYGVTGFVQGTGTIGTSTSPATVTGLIANQGYDFYLWDECAVSETSDTISTSFTTNEFAPPVNDLPCDAIVLACGDTDTASTLFATSFENPLEGLCGNEFNIMEGNTVWWTFVGTGEEVNISTCGSNFTTDMFIMSGECDAMECVVQSAYNSTPCGDWNSTEVSIMAEVGVNYYISISPTGTWTDGGEVVLNIECIPCSTPTLVASSQTDALANITWESFNYPADFTLIWDTAGFDYPTSPGNVITGNTEFDLPVLIEGLDSATTYDVYIFEYCESETSNSDTVMYTFVTNDSPPPANDEACNAIALTAGDTLVTTNSWASASPGEPVPDGGNCNDPDQMLWCIGTISNTTWYTYTPEMSGFATISTCHSNSYDTQMAVYTADDCNDYSTFSLTAANDDMGNCSEATNFTSAVSLCLEAGVVYYIQVDPYSTPSEWNPNPGQEFSISVEFAGAAIADNLEFINGPHTATVQWTYMSDAGGDIDFMFIYTNLSTGDEDTVMGNTSDLPIFLSGLDDDAEYEYYIYSNDMCTTTSGPHTFMTPVDGINELDFNTNVNVYPNPVTDKLTVEIDATVNEGSVISIINLQGQVIYSETIKENTSNYRTEIDVDNYARGMYLLKLEDENSSIQQRIIVQ